MPTKPTVKPQWAEDDVVDPTSGQNNVAEPPTSKKTDGIDRTEIIPRQWQNWLQRIIYRWVDWLDGTTIPLSSDVGTSNEQRSDGTGHTHALNGASQVEAEAGTNDEKVMTPLRTFEAIDKKLPESTSGATEVFSSVLGETSVDMSALPGGWPGNGFYIVELDFSSVIMHLRTGEGTVQDVSTTTMSVTSELITTEKITKNASDVLIASKAEVDFSGASPVFTQLVASIKSITKIGP